MGQLAVAVEHVDAAREAAHRHHVGIRALHGLAEQVVAVRRGRQAQIDAGHADGAGLAVQADLHRLRTRVVIEQARVGFVLQQILVGADGDHAAALAGLLHGRAGRDAIGRRRITGIGQAGHHDQAAAVGQPLVTVAEHRVEVGLQAARTGVGDVHQPQLVGTAGCVDLVEGQPLLVGRPGQAGDRQLRWQAADLPFPAVGHIHQPQLLAEAEAAVGERARVDADAGQLQFRLRHHLDRRQRRHLHQRGHVAAR